MAEMRMSFRMHCTILENGEYRPFSNMNSTKSQHLNVARLVLQLYLPNPLKPGVKSSMKMCRRCSNYIWVTNNAIAYQGVAYIIGLRLSFFIYGIRWHLGDAGGWKFIPKSWIQQTDCRPFMMNIMHADNPAPAEATASSTMLLIWFAQGHSDTALRYEALSSRRVLSLTHTCLHKMIILQTFWLAFSFMKIYEIHSKFHWGFPINCR